MIWLFMTAILAVWLLPWFVIVCLQSSSEAHPLAENSSTLRFKARWQRPVSIYMSRSPYVGLVGLRRGKKFFVYASRPLWESLTPEQQESAIMWLGFIDRYSSLLERLFWKARIHSADRETVLALADGSIWPSALALIDAYHQRLTTITPFIEGLWAGLGAVGPSLFASYPSSMERSQSMARYLAGVSNAR